VGLQLNEFCHLGLYFRESGDYKGNPLKMVNVWDCWGANLKRARNTSINAHGTFIPSIHPFSISHSLSHAILSHDQYKLPQYFLHHPSTEDNMSIKNQILISFPITYETCCFD
jgi:hypothetical protein